MDEAVPAAFNALKIGIRQMDITTTSRTRGADILWAALRQAGVTRVFSLSGNHIMPVYDAAYGQGIDIIHVRHEAAAVHMADAWARLTGECGVALVTGGQGHTNAVAGLPTAMAGEVPLLLLSGHAPIKELGLGAFQETPQVESAAPLVKSARMARDPQTLGLDVLRAIALAREGRPGPVHLSLPTDVLEAEVVPAAALPQAAPRAMPLAPEAARSLAAMLQAAERPLLCAGPALNSPEGMLALAALEAKTGLPVLLMESPRGLRDPSLRAATPLFAEADLIILLGKALDFTLGFGRTPPFSPAARWAVLEPDAAILARAAQGLGERLAFSAITAPLAGAQALAGMASTGHAAWAAQLRAALDFLPAEWDALAGAPEGPIHPVTLGHALRPWLRDGDVLVADGGEIGQWLQAMLRAPAGGARLVNGVAGAIGAGLPFAIAASAARPGQRVLAVMGDGTFGFHMAEFDTAVRHGLPFVAVVGNDSCWNAEHQIQLRDYGTARAHGCELANATRYDLVAVALGGHGEFVEAAAELAPALERAFASGKPACVNVMIKGLPAPVIRAA
jgi:acetolactate synthase-1/2/3 large subunit